MKKKININREKVSSEEIASGKNFDAILNTYSSTVAPKSGKPFYKSMGFAAGSIIAVIAGLTAAWWFTRTETPQQAALDEQFNNTTYKPASTASRLFINRPYNDLDVKFSTYIVNADKGGEVSHPSGTKIRIPANAFADENGKAVDGNVELKYREFRDPVDFFVSGIPMTYDSAGTTWQFESAGMMEILAYKNGKELNVSDGKTIEVEMPSKYDGSQYNLYQLDTAARNWVYKGKDKIRREKKTGGADQPAPVPQTIQAEAPGDSAATQADVTQLPEVKKISTEIAAIRKDIEKIEQQKPKEPARAHSDRHRFNLDVDPKEFPEIAVYKGMVFEVGAENKNFSKEMYKVVWDDAVLSEGSKKGINYKLTLTKGEEKKTIIVYPVLTGKNYEAALAEYNEKFKKYESALSVRKADEKKKEEEYKQALVKARQEQAARQKEAEEQRKAWAEQERQRNEKARIEARNTVANSNNITRVFMVSGFGVWNSDTPFKHTDPVRVAAKFSCSDTALNVAKVYHIDRSRNTLFTIYDQNFSRFEYSPSSANVLFLNLPGNKIAVFNENDFASLPKKNGAYNFNMKAVEKEFTSVDELKKFLLTAN